MTPLSSQKKILSVQVVPSAADDTAKPAAPVAAAAVGLSHPPGFVARRLVVFAGILLG
jgi:hypothetical protein